MPIAGSSNRYLVGSAATAVVIIWDGASGTATVERTVFTVPAGETFNSAYVGPNGELYVGTFGALLCTSEPVFSLYKYTPSGGLVQLLNGFVSIVGSVLVGQTLYHLDGCTKYLYALDLNPYNGAVSK